MRARAVELDQALDRVLGAAATVDGMGVFIRRVDNFFWVYCDLSKSDFFGYPVDLPSTYARDVENFMKFLVDSVTQGSSVACICPVLYARVSVTESEVCLDDFAVRSCAVGFRFLSCLLGRLAIRPTVRVRCSGVKRVLLVESVTPSGVDDASVWFTGVELNSLRTESDGFQVPAKLATNSTANNAILVNMYRSLGVTTRGWYAFYGEWLNFRNSTSWINLQPILSTDLLSGWELPKGLRYHCFNGGKTSMEEV